MLNELIKKTLALSGILFLLSNFLITQEANCQKEDLDSQKQLKQEIQILNLINGLYLSDEQMAFLMDKAEEAQDIREDYTEKHRQYTDDSGRTLERLKEELKEDKGDVSKDIAREVHQTNKKIRELRADYEKEMDEIIKEVKSNLNSNQLYIIESFKPCLIPPKGPLRVGQADEPTGGVKQLERIRNMPDYRYSTKKYEFADRILERVVLRKPKGKEIDEDEVRRKILSIFDEARGLSEVDFELKKEELVKELKQAVLLEPKTVDVDTKIERFLLNPVAITLLDEKLEDRKRD